MASYKVLQLKEMVETLGEDKVKGILAGFCCPLNFDVEDFLRNNAALFAKQGIGQTHLVYAPYKGRDVLAGYFTLAQKEFIVSRKSLRKRPQGITKSVIKKISRFGQYDDGLDGYRIPAPLIGQLGKNYASGYNCLLTGDELLKIACDKIKQVHLILGGKIVYLECEDKPKLVDFYCENGFVVFGERELNASEKGVFAGKSLLQLLRIL